MRWNILKKADDHEFKPLLVEIEDEPTSPIGRFILWCLFAAFVIGLLILFIGKIDVVINGRGLVIPEGEIKFVQPLEGGLISKINVRVGDFVKQGDVLMEIDPSVIEPDLQSKKENLNRLYTELTCLNGLLVAPMEASCTLGKYLQTQENMKSQMDAKNAQLRQLREEISSITAQIAVINKLLASEEERRAKLETVIDIISHDEYKRNADTILSLTKDKTGLEHNLLASRHQIVQLQKEIDVVYGGTVEAWQKEQSELEKSYSSLKAEVDQASFRQEKQHIYAPADGYVNMILVNTVGGVVQPAEQLMTIVPVNTDLVVKAQILNKDIGFISVGQECVVKMDTFDFQKYGKVAGTVQHIASDSIDNEQLGRVYEVYIKPDNLSLMVDGRETMITSGMSLTAEVKVGKRRVIEFFIYPAIKYLDEGLSVR
jgi:hemolysin D